MTEEEKRFLAKEWLDEIAGCWWLAVYGDDDRQTQLTRPFATQVDEHNRIVGKIDTVAIKTGTAAKLGCARRVSGDHLLDPIYEALRLSVKVTEGDSVHIDFDGYWAQTP